MQLHLRSTVPMFSSSRPEEEPAPLKVNPPDTFLLRQKEPLKRRTDMEEAILRSLLEAAVIDRPKQNKNLQDVTLRIDVSKFSRDHVKTLTQQLESLQQQHYLTLKEVAEGSIKCQLTPTGVYVGQVIKLPPASINKARQLASTVTSMGAGVAGTAWVIKHLLDVPYEHALELSPLLGLPLGFIIRSLGKKIVAVACEKYWSNSRR